MKREREIGGGGGHASPTSVSRKHVLFPKVQAVPRSNISRCLLSHEVCLEKNAVELCSYKTYPWFRVRACPLSGSRSVGCRRSFWQTGLGWKEGCGWLCRSLLLRVVPYSFLEPRWLPFWQSSSHLCRQSLLRCPTSLHCQHTGLQVPGHRALMRVPALISHSFACGPAAAFESCSFRPWLRRLDWGASRRIWCGAVSHRGPSLHRWKQRLLPSGWCTRTIRQRPGGHSSTNTPFSWVLAFSCDL
jgi:hypothetical protein